ncbi:hypothetical protein Tco_0778394 [Tanacetum coccineum]
MFNSYDVIRSSFESITAIKNDRPCGSLYTSQTVFVRRGVLKQDSVPNPPRNCVKFYTKEEEEKRISEEQAAKDRSERFPICTMMTEDKTLQSTPRYYQSRTPILTNNGDKHLDTNPETESDEFIKSSVENLVPIPSESEGIPDKMCDVPLCNNPTSLEAFKEHSETIIDYNDDSTSSDDDSYKNIEYVDASSPDVEIVSLEVVRDC